MRKTLLVGVCLAMLVMGGGCNQEEQEEQIDVTMQETTPVLVEEATDQGYDPKLVDEPQPVWERMGMTEAEYEAWAQETAQAREPDYAKLQEQMEHDMQAGGKLDQAKQRKDAFDARHGQ